ncbi:MCC1 [Scenedesmus sp. PABB004]|nr:MCC1 [Scenedesmus sp. PABB004]
MGLLSGVVDHDSVLYILTLGVVEGWRHRGIAAALIAAVCAHAAEARCRAVFLHVISYNAAAQALYARAGFACVARLPAFYFIATGRQPDPATQVYDAYLYVQHMGPPGLVSPWDLVTLAWSPLRSALGRIQACMPRFGRQQAAAAAAAAAAAQQQQQQQQQQQLLGGQAGAATPRDQRLAVGQAHAELVLQQRARALRGEAVLRAHTHTMLLRAAAAAQRATGATRPALVRTMGGGGDAQLVVAPEIPRVSAEEVAQRVRGAEGITVLDVRTAREFEAGHVKGAVNLAAADFTDSAAVDALVAKLDKPEVVVHCALSQRRGPASAAALAARLRELGVEKKITVMAGGFNEFGETFGADKEVLEGSGTPLPIEH